MKDLKIKNKIKRSSVFSKRKAEASASKYARRKELKRSEEKDPSLRAKRLEENVPKTIESKRELDDNIVADDEEVLIA